MVIERRNRRRSWNIDERKNEFTSGIGNSCNRMRVINNRANAEIIRTKKNSMVQTGVIFLESWSLACQPIVSWSRHVYLAVRSDRSSVYFQQPTRILSIFASSIPDMETERLNVCRLRCRFPEKTPANTGFANVSHDSNSLKDSSDVRKRIDDKLAHKGSWGFSV